MSDTKNIALITDFEVTVSHQFNNSKLVVDTPIFSEVNTFYSNTKRIGEPVKKYHTLITLLERLNNIKTILTKNNSIALLKGLYKNGTSGEYCYKGSPYLFIDIDVKKDKENTHLLDAKKNADVFEQLKKLAVLVWRSNSGKGIAGVLFVPQLADILNNDKAKHLQIGNAVTKYLKEVLKIDADFDSAQSKFRQIRYLAKQTEKRALNLNPITFICDVKEIPKVSNTGVKQYKYIDNRAVAGTVASQLNNNVSIHTALQDTGFTQLSDTRYLHPSTNSKSTGVTFENIFFNHSSSFSNNKVFTPFELYKTLNFNNDYKRYLEHLKKLGYKEVKPTQSTLRQSANKLKKQTDNRTKQIFDACYNLLNLSYKQKIKFRDKNAKNDAEKILFSDYLKLKPLTIKYDNKLNIQRYVSEQLSNILNYADANKKIILQAETGTGKTTAFLKDFAQLRPTKRLLLLAPLTAIVEQNKNEYENIVSLTASSEPHEHTKAKTSFFVMATYEQGYKHLASGNNFDYVVIDEAHNLITANKYKQQAITNLTSVLHRFTVIGLTGSANPLFSSIGYKLVKVNRANLKPVNIIMRLDNRAVVKIALQHLETVKGKCIMRFNSRASATDLKTQLIKNKSYSENEILILNSDASIKKGNDFISLTQNSCFNKNVKLVLTTSVIDEGLSIRQLGFTDVVFIENNYNPMPEAVKQFMARFRNNDSNRKNYFYFRETKDQSLNSWNPFYSFNQAKDELIQDSKDRSVNESKSNDIANNDYLFYSNGRVNDYALACDVSTTFFKKVTTLEYISFLELNYNLKITIDSDYLKEKIDVTDIKEAGQKRKNQIASYWLNQKDEVLNALYNLTDNRDIKNSIGFMGLVPENDVYDLVSENLKAFENLHKKSLILENLGVADVDAELINIETNIPINSQILNNKIAFIQTMETINNPKTATDKKNKTKLLNFIYEVGKLERFNIGTLVTLWKKQRTNSMRFNGVILKNIVLKYHAFNEHKKTGYWLKI